MEFEMLDTEPAGKTIIKVVGVGGAGGNAVQHMIRRGVQGVEFICMNTDAGALQRSKAGLNIQLGATGLGAGAKPEVGASSAVEAKARIADALQGAHMVFITAGMGGGTGTGAGPIVAQVAKEMGILTVGIVTTPFNFEGKRRKQQADEGLEAFKKHVDTLLVISNDKLREMYGNLTLSNAFAEADNILTTAAKGIAEIITVPGYINVDFEDVKTVMQNSGVAIMGSASAEGEGRAFKAVQNALASPLLNDNDIEGARYILLNITSGEEEVLMDEVSEITDYIQNQAGLTADIIWGNCYDETLGDKISVTLIATGFQTKEEKFSKASPNAEKKVIPLSIENNPTVEAVIPNINITIEQNDEVVSSVNRIDDIVLKGEEEIVDMEIEEPKAEKIEQEEESLIVRKAPPMVLKTHIVEESEQATFIKEDVRKEASASTKQVNLFDFIPAPEPKQEPVMEQEPFRLLDKENVEFTIINKTPAQSEEADELEEQMRKNKERINRLKELSMRLRTPNGVNDLESEPAYLRKKQALDNTPLSTESQVSRYTLNDDNGQPQIRPNNPFLHDNVD